jgi:hypothetical protein
VKGGKTPGKKGGSKVRMGGGVDGGGDDGPGWARGVSEVGASDRMIGGVGQNVGQNVWQGVARIVLCEVESGSASWRNRPT